MSINSVSISGNLTRDAERRGEAVRFTVAVNDRVRNRDTGEWEDRPNFVNCVIWGNYGAALYPHLRKGAGVAVEGKLRYSAWETDDGQRRSALDVTAREVFVGAPPKGDGERRERREPGPRQQRPEAAGDAYADEDLPF